MSRVLLLNMNFQNGRNQIKNNFRLGGRPYSKTNNEIEYEKLNQKTQKFVEVVKPNFDICG